MLIFFSYIFYFIAASASPLQRRWLAKRKDADSHSQINFAFRVTLVMVPLSLIIPAFSPFFIKGNIFYLFFLFLVCGILGALSVILNYVAQKHIEAGISSLVSNIYTPVTIILSSILLSEGLTIIQILGTVLLLTGMVIVAKKHHLGKFKFDKYFLVMMLSGILLGIMLVAERALQKTTGFAAGTLISWWSQCAFMGVAVLIYKSKHIYSTKDVLVTGVLRFLQGLSWVVLLNVVGNLSIVSAVTTFKLVIMFIAGALILKEKEDLPRKIFGSIVALAGLLLMG